MALLQTLAALRRFLRRQQTTLFSFWWDTFHILWPSNVRINAFHLMEMQQSQICCQFLISSQRSKVLFFVFLPWGSLTLNTHTKTGFTHLNKHKVTTFTISTGSFCYYLTPLVQLHLLPLKCHLLPRFLRYFENPSENPAYSPAWLWLNFSTGQRKGHELFPDIFILLFSEAAPGQFALLAALWIANKLKCKST